MSLLKKTKQNNKTITENINGFHYNTITNHQLLTIKNGFL